MRLISMALLALQALLLAGTECRADFFQYEDENGTVVMVDDESKIPPRYRKKTKSTKAAPVKESKVTAVRVRNNRVLVPVRLSYRGRAVEATLLLDTGASLTMITPALADRLGINLALAESGLSQVADGRVVAAYKTRIDYLALGPKQLNNPEVTIIPSSGSLAGFDGLLGMNFLGDFRYHVDVNNQVIEWQ